MFTSIGGSQAFNATFTSGQVLRIIIVTTTRQQGICDEVIPGIVSFFKISTAFFSILAVVLILIIIGGIVFVIQNPSILDSFNIDFSSFNLILIFLSMLVLAVIAIVSILTLNILCSI